jgi:16S rRNA (cytosine967-C5)-methyltransferase
MVREAATGLLSAVLDRGKSLDASTEPVGGDPAWLSLDERDRRLAKAIATTALRHHGEIDAALSRLIERRPRRAGRLSQILEVAAAQILFMEVADHAAVSVAVEQVAADRGARHFKGLANAVLRRLAGEREATLDGLDAPRLNTPDWLWRRWTAAYGEATARAIAEAHLVEPYLDLTVKADPAGWAERLGGVALATGSVRLLPSGPVEDLPGYAEGAWWVQDAAAAIPARLLGDVAGKRVADLCAAPGGKTAALALAGARVTAVDISAGRRGRLVANLDRLGLRAEIVTADILDWAPPEAFDAILLDAPCSATGTIRRHPDIAWSKRPEDVAALAELQSRMIDRAVGWLKPGGVLVFSTCSLEPEEGEDQMARALAGHALDVVPVAAGEIGGLAETILSSGAVRTLPSQLRRPTARESGLDGFFAMRVRRP